MYSILICDDPRDIVNALKIYLSPEGYNLYEAVWQAVAPDSEGAVAVHIHHLRIKSKLIPQTSDI